MQKKLKSLLAIASVAGSLAIFFIACGDGEMIQLTDPIINGVLDEAGNHFDSELGEKIDSLRNGTLVVPSSSSNEPEPEPSSSSQPPAQPSSSGGNDDVSSSSRAQSSSSAQNVQSSSSKAAVASSSSKGSTVVTGACVEGNPKAGFTCKWDGYAAGTTLTPGKTMKPASYTLPSGCSEVSWSYAPDTEMGPFYDCNEFDATKGFPALGSQNYVLFAKLTCSDGAHVNACEPKTGWSSKEAPKLTGTCVWDKNPTTTARGATPSGVKVVDDDKVCTSPTVVYKYADGSKTWSTILPEWKDWDKKHKETYEVVPTLNCSGYSQTVTTAPCPKLDVSAGADHIIECNCPGDKQCQIDGKNCKADSKAGKDVALKVDECVEINVYGYDNQYYLPKVGMRCQSNGSTYKISINGKESTGGNDLLLLGTMKLGDNEFGTFCITSLSGGTGSISCNLNGE